jgi:hypothetical protein
MLENLLKYAVSRPERFPAYIKDFARNLLILAGRLTHYRRMVPDFIIIGAQKCGTTSLYNYLIQHPRMKPGYKKEVHFFDNPDHFRKGIPWYRAHFPLTRHPASGIRNQASSTRNQASGIKHHASSTRNQASGITHHASRITHHASITGEATPSYLCHPDVPGRMREIIPHAKFIVLLRNPVDRAYSHYYHRVKHGTETLPFEMAVRKNQEIFSSYLARGVYADQLKRWMDIFPREQFLILSSEDFFKNPQEILPKVTEFLNLPDWEIPLKIFRKYNANRYPEMDEKTKEYLADYFKPHNERLYDFLGRNFGWK